MGLPQIVRRGELLAFLRYVRALYRATTRIAIVLDNRLGTPVHPQRRDAYSVPPRRVRTGEICCGEFP